jgi:hypothetical protein
MDSVEIWYIESTLEVVRKLKLGSYQPNISPILNTDTKLNYLNSYHPDLILHLQGQALQRLCLGFTLWGM